MGKTLTFIFTVICVAALTGCSGEAPQDDVPDAELVGTLWTLEAIEVPGEPEILPGATKVYSIQFSEDYLFEGHLDCNTYSGEYASAEGDLMQISIRYITKRGCHDSNKSMDERYSAGISAVYSFKIIGNQLWLYFDDSALKFQKME